MAKTGTSMSADSTLVSAAFKMGQARVPHDTAQIFKDQFEAMGKMYSSNMKNLGEIIKEGANTLQFVKDRKVFATKRDQLIAKNDSMLWAINKGFDNDLNQIGVDLLKNSGHEIMTNYQSGKGSDAATTKAAENEIIGIKNQIKELQSLPGERTREEKAQIKQLYSAVTAWRNENNASLADRRFYGDNLGNDNIDFKQSFLEKSVMTGQHVNNTNKQMLFAQVLHPGVNLDDVGIQMGRNDNGERGYYYDPTINRTLQMKRYFAGVKEDPTTAVIIPEKVFISEKKLFQGIVLKDNAVVADIGAKISEEIKNSSVFEPSFEVDATGKQVAKGKTLAVKNYSEISAKNEKGYYDLITSQYTKNADGSKGTKRNVKSGLIYMSNNIIEIGGKPINYNEDSKSNPNITALTYANLGLSGAVDINGDNLLTADELSQEDKNYIHNKLMNPGTPQEVEIAAVEFARYLNLQTKMLWNNERAKNGAYVASARPKPPKVKKTKTTNIEEGDFPAEGQENTGATFEPTKENITKYILENLDKFDLDKDTIEQIKRGERPLARLKEYLGPEYKA